MAAPIHRIFSNHSPKNRLKLLVKIRFTNISFGILLLVLLPGNFCVQEDINDEAFTTFTSDSSKLQQGIHRSRSHIRRGYDSTRINQFNIAIESTDGFFRRSYICAGVLVDKWAVVASASCFRGRNAKQVQIRDNLNAIGKVARIIRHPRFVEGSYYNDIAILKLKKPYWSPLLPNVIPRDKNLAFDSNDVDFQDDDLLSMEDWSHDEDEAEPDYLKFWNSSDRHSSQLLLSGGDVITRNEAPIISNEECESRYRKFCIDQSINFDKRFPRGIDFTLFCTEADEDIDCEDDKGYQLMISYSIPAKVPGMIKNVVLMGTRAQALEAGNGASMCELSWLNTPHIYTHILPYLDWILLTLDYIDSY